MSEAETEIRASLARLEDAASANKALSPEEVAAIRRQLEDSTLTVREQAERSKQVHEENAHLSKRREELEARLATIEQEYEELLGALVAAQVARSACADTSRRSTDKTMADEERADADHVQDVRVSSPDSASAATGSRSHHAVSQNKLEAQYVMKLDAAVNDVNDLKQQLELRNQEVRAAQSSIEQLRTANAELEVGRLPPLSVSPKLLISLSPGSERSRLQRRASKAARTSKRLRRTSSGSTRPSRSSFPTLTR